MYGIVTLRQVLLGIKTQNNWEWPLFLAIEVNSWMGDIQAVHHVDQATEAETLLAHLPVYLEVKFGSAIWKWISSDSRI